MTTGSILRLLALLELETPDDKREINVTQATDYHAVEDVGLPAEVWADARGVSEGAVDNSVRAVERALGLRDDPGDGE